MLIIYLVLEPAGLEVLTAALGVIAAPHPHVALQLRATPGLILVAHRAAMLGSVHFVVGPPQDDVPRQLCVAHDVARVVCLAVLLSAPPNQALVFLKAPDRVMET
jgi:hypothetical protein